LGYPKILPSYEVFFMFFKNAQSIGDYRVEFNAQSLITQHSNDPWFAKLCAADTVMVEQMEAEQKTDFIHAQSIQCLLRLINFYRLFKAVDFRDSSIFREQGREIAITSGEILLNTESLPGFIKFIGESFYNAVSPIFDPAKTKLGVSTTKEIEKNLMDYCVMKIEASPNNYVTWSWYIPITF
jgi:hypothetical protein